VKVLFDQNAPRPLIAHLSEHNIVRAAELGWERLSNGDLIASAEAQGFQVMVTSDKNLSYQQNLAGRKLAIVILPSGLWPQVRPYVAAIVQAVEAAAPGTFTEILPAPMP
jgi:hypothetical protein